MRRRSKALPIAFAIMTVTAAPSVAAWTAATSLGGSQSVRGLR